MINVVVRHETWGEGEVVGKFLPSEVDSVVDLVKNYGDFTGKGNEDLIDY